MKGRRGANVFLVFVLILSLSLNALLLYYISGLDNKKCNTKESIRKELNKEELGELFKNYQANNNLANADNVVIWNVTKITYKGFFKSNGRKLYYIHEKYSCMEGIDCINASAVETDDNFVNTTKFIVAVNDNDSTNIKFEILDESIEKDPDFVSEDNYDLK